MPAKKLQKKKRPTTKGDKGKQPTLTYLKSAPPSLIAIHENRKRALGRDILERLLIDEQMRRSWTVLSKYINRDQEWDQLWREIVNIKGKTKRKPTFRAKEQKKFLQITNCASKLADSVTDGPLDLLAYRLFPDEVMNILGITNWSSLDSLQQSDIAHNLLKEWPSIPELLNALAIQAQMLANDAKTGDRVTERNTGARLYFVRSLCEYFKKTYKAKLYGTVANIASVVLKYKIDKSYVENAVKGP